MKELLNQERCDFFNSLSSYIRALALGLFIILGRFFFNVSLTNRCDFFNSFSPYICTSQIKTKYMISVLLTVGILVNFVAIVIAILPPHNEKNYTLLPSNI